MNLTMAREALSHSVPSDEFTSLLNGTSVSVSDTFGPANSGAAAGTTARPAADMILLPNDSVVFYVDESTLLSASDNSFDHMLPLTTREKSQRTLHLPNFSSTELEIVLLAIYNHSNPSPSPSPHIDIQTIINSIDKFIVFGIDPKTCLTPKSPLFQFLLTQSHTHPLHVYALAAYHGIEDLAIAVSSQTLSLDISDISEDLARRMGSRYLMRLFRLHLERVDVLQRLLATRPGSESPHESCDQRALLHNWTLGVATLMYLVKAGGWSFFILLSFFFVFVSRCSAGSDVSLPPFLPNLTW
ncbi:hypothetical protein PM082_015146 [Marasmius tenuissimus]|nr:hypothetical protein PM082_015146 [Marasmius tenuissimus]